MTDYNGTVMMRAGRYLKPVTIEDLGNRWKFRFGFNRALLTSIKTLQGRKWHPEGKYWTAPKNRRNYFTLDYLTGKNPYQWYERDLVDVEVARPLRNHQILMLKQCLTYRKGILACEMGTGKTLVAIEVMERAKVMWPDTPDDKIWYVGPKAGVVAVRLELEKWQCTVKPSMMTYERFTRRIKEWSEGAAPRVVIFDESSKLKTHSAQRSQAAMHLAESMTEVYGNDCFIIEMSGSPAPKDPSDWWSQAEIVCPGFLAEGHPKEMKNRMALIEEMESPLTGAIFPKLITWLDDENKCAICGKFKEDHEMDFDSGHAFKQSINEVEKLYRRLKGLALVIFKKDCTDLPDKQYIEYRIKPTASMLRASKLIQAKAKRAITAMILMRELSDGFQYTEVEVGVSTCPNCHGAGVVKVQVPTEAPGINHIPGEDTYEEQSCECDYCSGSGEVPKMARDMDSCDSPKDEKLSELLEECDEDGRIVIWGGFTGTIDRLVQFCHKKGWATLKVDGKGYIGQNKDGESIDAKELLLAMDASHPRRMEYARKYPKIAFIGHPQAGGMALTLTASNMCVYYSNSFNGEARIQSEDRIHRVGMDLNRGCKIIDLLCLPVDKVVLDNLKQKKRLQSMSMGDLQAAMISVTKEKEGQ